MTESQQQQLFVKLLAEFMVWVYQQENGKYSLTFGEAWRTKEQADLNAAKGIGIKNSLHKERLAVDLNLCIDGVYTDKAEDYKFLGDKWVTYHELCRWGGNFSTVDADHFSMEWHGIK